jgi:hypothetical protein
VQKGTLVSSKRSWNEAKRATAIDLLAAGQRHGDVALAVNVSRTTLWRWLGDPEFTSAVARRRSELWSEVLDRIRGITLGALVLVERSVADGDYTAARDWLRLVIPGLLPSLVRREEGQGDEGAHRGEQDLSLDQLDRFLTGEVAVGADDFPQKRGAS